MANMIIRPASGSGNKVIVQEQAGAAVLTTADSGATVANATLTAPILGTPTSGTLTNCTFPAGHTIQTVTRQYSTSNGDSCNSTSLIKALDASVAQYYCTINNVLADSKVLINFHWQVMNACTAIEVGGGYGIYRENSVIYETAKYVMYDRQDGVSGNHETSYSLHVTYLDTAPATGTNTYYLGIKSHETGYTTTILSGLTPFHAILQEVA